MNPTEHREDAKSSAEETPVARLTITITYLAPLKGQKTSKVRVETVGEVAGSQNTEHRNHWTVWGDEEGKLGSALAGGVYEEIEEPLRAWAASAEHAQCRIWRAELSQRLLAELASSPEGPREYELRRMLTELEGPRCSAASNHQPTSRAAQRCGWWCDRATAPAGRSRGSRHSCGRRQDRPARAVRIRGRGG